MFNAAINFFILALVMIGLGLKEWLGVSPVVGKVLFAFFLACSLVSFALALMTGHVNKNNQLRQ